MRLYTAPENSPFYADEPMIFLAGSIEMGKAKMWQDEITEKLKDLPVIVFNPRRANWDSTWKQDISNPIFKQQVDWELDHIQLSNIVFFYIQGDTLSPITLMELGIILGDNNIKSIVVCEPNFWRLGNVQILCHRHNVRVYDDLNTGVDHLIDALAEFSREY